MMWVVVYLQRAVELAWSLPLLLALELLLPRGTRPTWRGRAQAAVFWLVYLVGASGAMVMASTLLSGMHLAPLIDARQQAPVAGVAVAILLPFLSDFFYYWFHRAQHAWPVLWRFHAVHHAIRDMSAVNAYHHWTEEIFRMFFMALPPALLFHFNAPALSAYVAVRVLLGHNLHATTTFNLGPLNRILADNRTHRVHHSLEARHFGKNFGSFSTVWDQVFRTAYFPTKGEWPDVGLAGQAETSTLGDYLLARRRA